MMRGIFVTGTDTGIGKTVVSAALLCRLGRPPFRYWKPIQTGIEQDDDTATVARLSGVPRERILDDGIRLPRPVSPHLAAALSGTTIALADILSIAARQPSTDRWIVEGAGGVLVPINDRANMSDVMLGLGLPALIVARSGLGTINHTLLSLEALRQRRIPIAGVVMVGERNADNRAAIERFGKIKVVGELPWLDEITPHVVRHHAEQFDSDYVLGFSETS
jgi:dethiobiotin synthetase